MLRDIPQACPSRTVQATSHKDDGLSAFAGTWRQIEVGGHTADVYEPPKPNEFGHTVLFLHGVHVGRLIDNGPFCREFDRHGLRVIAPISGASWWSSKICPAFDKEISAERYLLDRVMPYLADDWKVKPPRVALLGTSMGGQGALRLSYKYPERFPIVAAIAPAIDYQNVYYEYDTIPTMYPDPEAVRQDTATLHIHPLNWPRNMWFACDPADERWFDSSDRLKMKLYSLGIMHECDLETTAGGHGWSYYNVMAPKAIDFIAARLEQERLRLPLAGVEPT